MSKLPAAALPLAKTAKKAFTQPTLAFSGPKLMDDAVQRAVAAMHD